MDLESTGLDKVKDRPIELGVTLWTTKYSRGLDSQSILIKSDGVPVVSEITEITGITQDMVDNFGYEPDEAFEVATSYADRAQAIVAFNGRRFDIPMFQAMAKRLKRQWPDKLIIDPFVDLPMRGQELITMCAKMGIYYDPHEAGADVNAMLRLTAKFPFDIVLERAKSPVVVVQSKQSYGENEKAKKHKFRWNPGEKIWWKAVKEIDMSDLNGAVN
ncbi:DNA polymerase III PolC-type [uncultured archaeon]|nr:DNA polymerase III PolC-type [uncultured archaeon]